MFEMSSDMPNEFRLAITSFYGRSFSLILRDGKLHYSSTRPENKLTREPAGEDWRKFWKNTVKLKIWLWNDQYVDKSSSDGSSWSLSIEVANLKLKTYGSNNKPENFNEFLQAVKGLVPGIEMVMY